MKSITIINSINDVEESKRPTFEELLLTNYSLEIGNFLQSNKKHIKEKLSGSQKTIFENDVLKKHKMKIEFFEMILKTLDGSIFKKLIEKIIKSTFKDEKVLCDSFLKENKIDEEKLFKFIASSDEKKQKCICTLFDCINFDIDISQEKVDKIKKEISMDALETQLNEKQSKIDELTKQIQTNSDIHKKEVKTLEEKSKKESKEKDDTIKKLETEISELKKKVEAKETKLDKEKVLIIEQKKSQESSNESNTKNEENFVVDFETAINDLEARTLLGIVRPEGIQVDKGFIVITPIVPIINENSNINREEFIQKVDYRSDYSTFILFLNMKEQDVLGTLLPGDMAREFPYMSNDQKFKCLFESLNKKILFFTPHFVKKDNEKYKLNAYILGEPVRFEDFNNSTFVPRYDGSKKEFESKVNKHFDLALENFPYSLSSNLKYVLVKDTLYEINYIPRGKTADNKCIMWKYNEGSTKEPFKKMDIKITNSISDKYIFTPSPRENTSDDLYVKNILFMQSLDKANAIFNEGEFINNVSNNAISRNLYYKDSDLRKFHVAVKTSNLVILAGPSGIGKTKLPMVYANTLGLDSARNTILFVPISPSYLEPEDVLGYIRPISEENSEFNAEFMESQTGLVSFLIDAAEHKDKIHLVVFDEMNLSQIEYWFAPFISLLEQDSDSRELKLYSNNLNVKNGYKYPSSINIGENVIFIGTINIDETTKQISDRLLDRAIVINLASPSFIDLKNMKSVNSENYPEISYSRFSTAVNKISNSALELSDREFALVNELNSSMANSFYNKSISFRSLNKMALYLKNSTNILDRREALDFVISQIVLKKINGSKEELDELLCDDDTQGILKILNSYSDISDFAQAKREVRQKILEINKYGFTR